MMWTQLTWWITFISATEKCRKPPHFLLILPFWRLHHCYFKLFRLAKKQIGEHVSRKQWYCYFNCSSWVSKGMSLCSKRIFCKNYPIALDIFLPMKAVHYGGMDIWYCARKLGWLALPGEKKIRSAQFLCLGWPSFCIFVWSVCMHGGEGLLNNILPLLNIQNNLFLSVLVLCFTIILCELERHLILFEIHPHCYLNKCCSLLQSQSIFEYKGTYSIFMSSWDNHRENF